jgi:hypothetical protein
MSVTYNRVPYLATIAIPNSIFQLPAGTLQSAPQAQENTVDILKAISATPAAVPAFNATHKTVSAPIDRWGHVSNFLGHYWPFLALGGAVFVGMLLVLGLVFRFR